MPATGATRKEPENCVGGRPGLGKGPQRRCRVTPTGAASRVGEPKLRDYESSDGPRADGSDLDYKPDKREYLALAMIAGAQGGFWL
jgi:hypothetical protein